MWWRCLLICAVAAVKMAFVSIELAMASPWENDSKKKDRIKEWISSFIRYNPCTEK